MPARLIANPGRSDERVFVLAPGSVTIGRSPDSDVHVMHESLSRQHARLTVGPAGAVVDDLGSRNGTYVDGVRVQRSELPGACYLKCGDVVFAFVPEEPPASRPLPSPSLVHDTRSDPSLAQLLAGDEPTALHLRARDPGERARDQLAVLLRVSELLSAPAPVDELLGRALDLLFEILDVDRAVFVLRDDAGALGARARKARGALEATFSRQVVSYVLSHGVAALFSNAQHDARIAGASILAQSVQTSMCAPLRGRERVHGALYVDNLRQTDRYGAEDLGFLSAFANQVAVALDNARLSARLAEEAVKRSALMRFFPPAVVARIGGAALDIVEVDATVLMADLVGYTDLSASMPPRALIELLNAFFPRMARIVFDHEGTLEKYIGDALLAVWGAPVAQPDHAERALRAALAMQHATGELGGVSIHIGMASGPVAAGNVGSTEYLQYATVGETTSLASRICDLAGPGEILIEERTAAAVAELGFDVSWQRSAELAGRTRGLFRVR